MAEKQAAKQGKKNRKLGRVKDSPSQKRYVSENHLAINKKRREAKDAAKKADDKAKTMNIARGSARALRRGKGWLPPESATAASS